MKCNKCGFENKDSAKFCTKCGENLEVKPQTADSAPSSKSNSKYIILALVVVIIILVGSIGYFVGTMDSGTDQSSQSSSDAANTTSQASESSSSGSSNSQSTSSSSSSSESKSWESIGSYSGSGSGSQTINVPAGQIMVKLSAYPIKNYATNHLYVSGSNGQSGGVDWGSHSDVETRSDSFTFTSSSSETFTIDYYETVSWQVEFYRYQ